MTLTKYFYTTIIIWCIDSQISEKSNYRLQQLNLDFADVAELADAPDLGSGVSRRGGSSPLIRTIEFYGRLGPPFGVSGRELFYSGGWFSGIPPK